MAKINETFLNYAGIIFLALALFGSGFYFGFQNGLLSGTENSEQKIDNIAKKVSQDIESTLPTQDDHQNTTLNEVDPNIFWIKAGQEPSCPKSHPVKGKFDSAANLFYTPDNQYYNRVKAQVCFASENFAREIAGFIKKY